MNKLSEYSKAKVVVTDRLHGMIFSAIVGTPCVCIDNVSHKVKNCYSWLKHLDYVFYCENKSDFFELLNSALSISNMKNIYNFNPNKAGFEIIKNTILDQFNS